VGGLLVGWGGKVERCRFHVPEVRDMAKHRRAACVVDVSHLRHVEEAALHLALPDHFDGLDLRAQLAAGVGIHKPVERLVELDQ
jgi:hypothetical protein